MTQDAAFRAASAQERGRLREIVDDMEAQLTAAASGALAAASSRDNLAKVMQHEIRALLEKHRATLASGLQPVIRQECGSVLQRALRSLDEDLDAAYSSGRSRGR